jgi:hypothetical protein
MSRFRVHTLSFRGASRRVRALFQRQTDRVNFSQSVAIIFLFDPITDAGRWNMTVLNKNGAYVSQMFVHAEEPVPMVRRCI